MLKNPLFNILFFISIFISSLFSNDLEEIKKRGELRHLGFPYANFITGLGDGLDVELIKGFAKYINVEYKFVPSLVGDIFGNLTGQNAKNSEKGVVLYDNIPIKGDVIAAGLTILDWRKEVVNFSRPTFPSGVWLVSRANSSLVPINPTSSINNDINLVKKSISSKTVLAMENTCLDPRLYKMKETTTAQFKLLDKESTKFIDLIPAIINKYADATLLDVPDALIALEKWPGEIKIIGPISQKQEMAVGFRKNSPQLLIEFNKYLKIIREDGTYNNLVKKYYPDIFHFSADFFK
ncbi:MAG: ABC transporter substrate-binding protein [Arcobacter sp.]|nr:ABC transporter substrate-binding protein [Arcobacter sp.]|tara:strand:+ start:2789 stop:3670 length:882 start_codon:yes stop_codon:yes gene_type:complete